MPNFAYSAVTTAGKRVRGRADSASAGALSRSLEEQGMFILSVEPASESALGGGSSEGRGFRFGRKREVLEVTRALAALLPAGMPLAQALGAASNVATGDVRVALQQVRARIERGEGLATALAAHPHLFSPLYIGLVRAGEKSGGLDQSFGKLAVQLERDEELRSKVLSSMIYPLILASVGGVAVIVLLMFVLPRFVELLQGSGAALPGSTAMLLALATGLRKFWYLLFLIPIIGFWIASWIRNTPEGKLAASRFMLATPVVRTLRQYALAARFARIISVLLSGGAPLLTALDDGIESIGDPIAKDEMARIRQKVREGISMKQAVSESPLFPPLLPQLVGVGEDSSRLRDFLEKAADIFEEKTERAAQRLATLAEPVMIVFFGTIVAFVALSLLQAIYGVNASSFN